MNPIKRISIILLSCSAIGLGAIGVREGSVLKAYKDEGGVWTIGKGHTEGVKPGDTITKAQETALLEKDVSKHEAGVKKYITANLTQYEYDAIVSWTYNVGVGNLARSTLRRKFNAGDHAGGCKEMLKWVYIKGRWSRGLYNRRQQEYRQCMGYDVRYQQ